MTSVLSAQDKKALPDSISVDATLTTTKAVSADSTVTVGATTDTTLSSTGSSIDTATQSQEPEPAADSVILRTIPDATVKKYKDDRDFEYANDPRYWKPEEPERSSGFGRFLSRVFRSEWFRWFIYCLLAGVLIYAIYKIVAGNRLHLFYKSSPEIKPELLEEHADIYQEGLDKKITTAIAEQDVRNAVRYLFLKALRVLNDKDLIRYHAETTNQEYIEQLKGHPQEKDFQFLVYAYEHVWYGERQLGEQQFKNLVRGFENFYRTEGAV